MENRNHVAVFPPRLDVQVDSIPTDLPGLWYVAHTRARNEKALVDDLSRLGIVNYLPLVSRQTRSRRTRRVSRSVVPVFPGYVFFNADQKQRHQALTTNRIARVLVVPEQQQFVRELQRVHTLLRTTDGFSVTRQLAVGEWGRITAGPLCGLEGIVVRAAARWRLSLNVTILGQCVQVDVDEHDVEPVDAPEAPSHPPAGRYGP